MISGERRKTFDRRFESNIPATVYGNPALHFVKIEPARARACPRTNGTERTKPQKRKSTLQERNHTT